MRKLSILLLFIWLTKINAQVCFNTPSLLPAGTQPVSICYADFNTDGKIDLATSNRSDSIEVFLGTGTGGFNSPISFVTGLSPEMVISADINSDGKVDLATVNFYSNDVSILLGTGGGSFSTANSFSVGSNPFAITCGDFNGDANLDLATANGSHDISILLGTGTGSFGAPTNFNISNAQLTDLVCSDFNGDNKTDLAVLNGGDSLFILFGTGTGGFGSVTNIFVGTNISSSAILSKDLNGDGKIDLAVTNHFYSPSSVFVLLGNGTGNFSAPTSFTVGSGPQSIISGDFDGDGNIDLATTGGVNNISVILGTGTGSFGPATNFLSGTTPESIITADFNGDLKNDLAVANYNSNNVSLLLNCNNVNIDNYIDDSEASIYPNPTSDQFFIDANTTDKLTVDLFDVNGRHVFNANLRDKENINVASLDNGAYTLTIKTADRVINKKLVILR